MTSLSTMFLEQPSVMTDTLSFCIDLVFKSYYFISRKGAKTLSLFSHKEHEGLSGLVFHFQIFKSPNLQIITLL